LGFDSSAFAVLSLPVKPRREAWGIHDALFTS